MKKIYMIAVGGTISYMNGEGANKTGTKILREADIPEDVDVIINDLFQKSSSSMTVQDLFDIARTIKQYADEDADGVIVTQGTDTIEETAYLLNLVLNVKIPVIITGAMKHEGLKGSDGGSNLEEAIIAACSDKLKNSGAVVVFDGQIHSGLFVKKTHTQSLDTFKSEFGSIGYYSEGRIRVVMNVIKPVYDIELAKAIDMHPADVYMMASPIGEDGRMLEYVERAGYKGIVIEGLGGGHVSSMTADRLKNIQLPVVMSSRAEYGEVLTSTYAGYPGAEKELIKNGVIYSGALGPAKARLLLTVLLTLGYDKSYIADYFNKLSIIGG